MKPGPEADRVLLVHMRDCLSTLSSKGRVTVPKDVRERLGLQAGDKIAWSLLSNGTIVLRPQTRPLTSLVGLLTQAGQPEVAIAQMKLPE